MINSAVEKQEVVFRGRSALLGVNIYNAVYFEGYIISKFFVMYGDKQAPNVEYGDFVIETPCEGILTKIYRL